jgi:predicted phage terminase large subunit-like protein
MRDKWSIVYKRAIESDGSLLFPERLSPEFLDEQRKIMGSYLFSNQYLNQVVPDDQRKFRQEWIRYYEDVPQGTWEFAFIDPAIGQEDHHDYTALVVISVTHTGDWYVRIARRHRLTPTEIIDLIFRVQEKYKCRAIGIETVAYQESLMYILDERMKHTAKVLPVIGIKSRAQTKNARIEALIPRFEWNRIFLARGLTDLEDEYFSFPRSAHDDILDALASLEEIVSYPTKEDKQIERPHSPNHPDYERWYRQELARGAVSHNRAEEAW